MSERVFLSPRLFAAVIAGAAVLFAASLYLMSGQGREPGTDGTGPSSFSHSALGYAGFAEMLRGLGATVVQSRFNSTGKMTKNSVLIIAEPRLSFDAKLPLQQLLRARAVLLVLPKWRGEPSERKPAWIGKAALKAIAEPQITLENALTGGKVIRRDAVDDWDRNDLNVTPSINGPVQLIQSAKLRPIVADGDGILVGELRDKGRVLIVLSDPDILANHGIGRGDNGLFGLALINALRGAGGGIVFDETQHGFAAEAPSEPLPLLFRFPFSLATLQAVLALALLLWATMPRFGAPEKLAPPLEAGKLGLVRNAARLITFGGHRRIIAGRYAQAIIRDAAARLHTPPGLDEGETVDRLRRIGQLRGMPIDVSVTFYRIKDLAADPKADPALLAPLVRDLHLWKQSITDESPGRSIPR
ncbi:MAG TPA: DUF4350 domain-containing protein [Aliidongia sp.]|nr:DUF4350 domain-containing protein [Aliidongia sp.]